MLQRDIQRTEIPPQVETFAQRKLFGFGVRRESRRVRRFALARLYLDDAARQVAVFDRRNTRNYFDGFHVARCDIPRARPGTSRRTKRSSTTVRRRPQRPSRTKRSPARRRRTRIENTLSFIRFGFTVLPPGSRLDTSDTLTICKWPSAALSITREVLMLLRFSRAVTTTSESFRSAQHNRKTRSSLSPVTFNSLSRATYPRHETLTGCLPACTFLIEKCPLSSVIAHRFASTTVTTAIGTPFDDLPICTLPDIVYFCAEKRPGH